MLTLFDVTETSNGQQKVNGLSLSKKFIGSFLILASSEHVPPVNVQIHIRVMLINTECCVEETPIASI